jgi:hypothetical protein
MEILMGTPQPDLSVIRAADGAPQPAAPTEHAEHTGHETGTPERDRRNLADLAAAERRRRQRPRRVMPLTRLRIGLRRQPRMSRRAIQALVAEQEGIDQRRDPGSTTHGEANVRSVATRRSDGVISRTARRLHRITRRIDRLRARRAILLARVALIPAGYVAHPDGGRQTVRQTQADAAALNSRVQDQIGQGSRKHHRAPAWFRFMPRVVLVFDLALLLYFISGITDVNWAAPLSLPLAFAAGLALMVTVVCYVCFAFAGHQLRRHKDDTGAIPLSEVDWLTRLLVIACSVGVVLVGLLMFTRMWSEVLLALGNGAHTTALAVAAAVTAVSVLANIMVIVVHATDGSEETGRLGAFGATLRHPLRLENRLRRRASRLEHRIGVRERKAERVCSLGLARSERPFPLAEEIIGQARAHHQQTGPLSDTQPADGVRGPERALRLAVSHAHTELAAAEPAVPELAAPATAADEPDQRAG